MNSTNLPVPPMLRLGENIRLFSLDLQLDSDVWSKPMVFFEIFNLSSQTWYRCICELAEWLPQRWVPMIRRPQNHQAVLHPLVHTAAVFANLDVTTFVVQLFDHQLGRDRNTDDDAAAAAADDKLASRYVEAWLRRTKDDLQTTDQEDVHYLLIKSRVSKMRSFAARFDEKLVYYQLYKRHQLISMIELAIRRILELTFRTSADLNKFNDNANVLRQQFL